MSFSLRPDFLFRKLTDISPQFLARNGIRLLMLDLDNTVAPYNMTKPSEKVLDWCYELKKAGITLYFVSNSRVPGRVEAFAGAMEIGFSLNSKKPSVNCVNDVLRRHGISPRNAALVGDQIFTDVLGANLADTVSILVLPISFSPRSWANTLRLFRYIVETPFRLLAINKIRR